MFKVRTSKPNQWNKLYNNANNGGVSWCINGNPTDPISNVLANCVGYACSRFNEIYNELTGYDDMKYKQLCCNAEDFWTVAEQIGLQRGQEPKAGAIMVWLGHGDAAGHVAIVERVDNSNQVYTSESGYMSSAFWNSYRYRGTDGNWGIGAGYTFLGFIYNPAVTEYKWEKKTVWFLKDGQGNILTGWQKVDGKWYYLNAGGVMQTGWQYVNGAWYLLGYDGAMLTGWQKRNGKWYYLAPTQDSKHKEGQMWTGWLFDKGYDGWFLFSNNGDMLTGWQKVGGVWYYLATQPTGNYSTGEMYRDGTYTINGKQYTFNKDGAWIG